MKTNRITLVLLPLFLLASCKITIGGFDWSSDRTLSESHEETLIVENWHPEGVIIDSALGDIRVLPTDGENRIVATVLEEHEGDGYVVYEDGKLEVRSHQGDEDVLLGDTTIYVATPVQSMWLSTGVGDVEIDGALVLESVHANSGMGDVEVDGLGDLERIVLNSGMGDVECSDSRCQVLQASTGMGDVDVRSVRANTAELSSGMGSLDLRSSTFLDLEADSGMGSIHCRDVKYQRADLDTGLGSVDED